MCLPRSGSNIGTDYTGDNVQVTVLDSLRKRVYHAPVGLWLTLDAGQFQSVSYDTQSRVVHVTLAPADASTPVARLRLEQPGKAPPMNAQARTYAPSGSLTKERDGYTVPLATVPTTVDLIAP
jgi:hypothetical protein